ncbi:Uncharacterised protein [Klebsiella pneumoniae]|nr:Uncharacterised protein [Klebsiella pneumoniae]
MVQFIQAIDVDQIQIVGNCKLQVGGLLHHTVEHDLIPAKTNLKAFTDFILRIRFGADSSIPNGFQYPHDGTGF